MSSKQHPDQPTSSPCTFVGIDIGGTFTDAVFLVNGRLTIHKTLTTPKDPAQGVLNALEMLPPGPFSLTHGSTLATNATLERRGAKTAFITTAGFEDILRIARQDRRQLYSFEPEEPIPLVPRERCFGFHERVDAAGKVLQTPDEERPAEILAITMEQQIESVAVCLLFSYKNDTHEKMIRDYFQDRIPFISLSSEVLPEYREYERASTTVLNAYVSPILDRYITRLDKLLRERGATDFKIMESGGGILPAVEAGKMGVRTILSGPAGGVAGAFRICQSAGVDKIVTLDMGGTSTDVSLCDGAIGETREGDIDGFPLRIPMVDIVTIGAGGGSLAYIDSGGVLRVGPESAGSDPGPAAFGRGENPTVTDAHLVLGTLAPEDFLGGNFPVNRNRAITAVKKVADPLGITVEEAAAGIVRIAISHMERALRVVTLQRGYDPAPFTLVPFGGAGPLHAPYLAETLGMKQVLVPRYPGVLSALGMLLCDFRMDFTRTLLLPAEDVTSGVHREVMQSLFSRASEYLQKNYFRKANIQFIYDMRYRGQSFELPISAGSSPCEKSGGEFRLPAIPAFDAPVLMEQFHQEHEKRYGYARREEAVEVVNVRINLMGRSDEIQFPRRPITSKKTPKPSGKRSFVLPDGSPVTASLYHRESLQPGMKIPSPSIILQYDTIIPIPPSWSGRVDEFENILLKKN